MKRSAIQFAVKARNASRVLGVPITGDQLAQLWNQQEGRCGLTGTPLVLDGDDSMVRATLDHIIPISRGGDHALTNLRWVSSAANRAKGDLLDHEFVAVCQMVINHLSSSLLGPFVNPR